MSEKGTIADENMHKKNTKQQQQQPPNNQYNSLYRKPLSSVTMEPKKSEAPSRVRSGSVDGIGSENSADNGDTCGSNAICGMMSFSGLPLLGGRRMSLSQDRWICPNDRQLALRAK